MPGHYNEEGLLRAVETRTSSSLRLSRDSESLVAIAAENLFPARKGAGFDGGIVSVDGFAVTEALSDQLYGEDREERSKEQRCRMSVWKMRVQICINPSDITIKPLSLTTCRMSVWKMRV